MKRFVFFLSLILLFLSSPVHAQPQSIPNGPWVEAEQTVQLQAFLTVDELEKKLLGIEARSKGRLKVEVAGYSATLGYPIFVAKFGEPDENKIGILIQSTIHGDEEAHVVSCVELIQTLATSGNKDVLEILNRMTIWIIPMLNPSGVMFEVDGSRWPKRLNTQTWDPTEWGLPSGHVAPHYYGSRFGVYGYDLNRDFHPNLDFVLNPATNNKPRGSSRQAGFLVTPEARASAALFKALKPKAFIDLHHQYPTYAQGVDDNDMNTLQILGVVISGTSYTDLDGNLYTIAPEVLALSKQMNSLVYQELTENGNSHFGNITKYAPINYPGSALGAYQLNGAAIMLFEIRGGSIYDTGQKANGVFIKQTLNGLWAILMGFVTGEVYDIDPTFYDTEIPGSGPRIRNPHPNPQP
jgi:hypothetical protein